MGGYFKPVRRKIGALALLVACVFMSFWVNGSDGPSAGMFKLGENAYVGIIFSDACISWATVQSDGSTVVTPLIHANLGSEVISALCRHGDNFDDLEWRWRRQWCGLCVGDVSIQTITGARLTVWMIHYWVLVWPLTLLSSFLLLSKPRQSTQKKIIEPTPENVA